MYYRWRVFVDESKSVLEDIEAVQYLLHPTFPDPLRIRTSKGEQFGLETTGWGEFTLSITVQYRDGTESKAFYRLDLSKDWPCESRGC